MKWEEALLKTAKEIMLIGGEFTFIVWKKGGNQRKPIIKINQDNEVHCDEETITIVE